jgi:hypothetical protein
MWWVSNRGKSEKEFEKGKRKRKQERFEGGLDT